MNEKELWRLQTELERAQQLQAFCCKSAAVRVAIVELWKRQTSGPDDQQIMEAR